MKTGDIELGFDKLPEAKDWKVGDTYRVRMVLKQTSLNSQSATFEIVDASSLEAVDKAKSNILLSDEGMYMGK